MFQKRVSPSLSAKERHCGSELHLSLHACTDAASAVVLPNPLIVSYCPFQPPYHLVADGQFAGASALLQIGPAMAS